MNGEAYIFERVIDLDWYVIRVFSGQENKISESIMREIERDDECLASRAFVPRREKKRRYKGAWHLEEEILFPGYVFVECDDVIKLQNMIRKIQGLTKLLGTGAEPVPISSDEKNYIKMLIGERDVMEYSYGYIEGDKVMIISGPLLGSEGSIERIDRHKRNAKLRVMMFDSEITVDVPLEIIKKDCECL